MGEGMSIVDHHLGAVFTLVISSLIIFGSTIIFIRTTLSLHRLIKSQKIAALARRYSESSRRDEEVEIQGGARKLRKMLVICLMASDGLIALSCLGPAAMGVAKRTLVGHKCDPAGFILATALWWQYGFSMIIAITTYIALRHPLSRIKQHAERRGAFLIVGVLVAGIVQSILWRHLETFGAWRDYCFYGPPSSQAAELIQFIPRIITSVVIALIYLPLIHFLRRPDLSSLYLSPQPDSKALERSITTNGEVIPPWERLSFPNFTGLGITSVDDKGSNSLIVTTGSGMIIPFSPTPVPVPSPPQPVYYPDSRGWSREEKRSMTSEVTLVASLFPLDPRGRKKSTSSSYTMRSQRSSAMGYEGRKKERQESNKLDKQTEIEVENRTDLASFRGMLECVPHSRDNGTYEMDRSDTPAMMESMASFINKRTSSFLIWFPLTHLIIATITIIRFIYFVIRNTDSSTTEALTIIIIMGQGVADIIVFGIIETHTQRRYQQEMESTGSGEHSTGHVDHLGRF